MPGDITEQWSSLKHAIESTDEISSSGSSSGREELQREEMVTTGDSRLEGRRGRVRERGGEREGERERRGGIYPVHYQRNAF